ncbi:MAG: flagellar biosynthetic protein FliO [Granulosicoccus sp.]
MFPCISGRCLLVAGISLLSILPVGVVMGAEPVRTVVSPLVTLGKLAVALVVVLVVFWLFARVMRQFQGFQGGMHHGLKIISALSVGQRERVIVVQAGEQQLVLGVTSSNINTLYVLERPLAEGTTPSGSGDFKNKLNAALKRQVPVE